MVNNNLRNEILKEIDNIEKELKFLKYNILSSSTQILVTKLHTLHWVLEKMDTPAKFDKYGCQRLAVIYVDKTKETEEYLIKMGYNKRSGEVSSERNTIAIVMGKKWFWESSRKNKEISYDYF